MEGHAWPALKSTQSAERLLDEFTVGIEDANEDIKALQEDYALRVSEVSDRAVQAHIGQTAGGETILDDDDDGRTFEYPDLFSITREAGDHAEDGQDLGSNISAFEPTIPPEDVLFPAGLDSDNVDTDPTYRYESAVEIPRSVRSGILLYAVVSAIQADSGAVEGDADNGGEERKEDHIEDQNDSLDFNEDSLGGEVKPSYVGPVEATYRFKKIVDILDAVAESRAKRKYEKAKEIEKLYIPGATELTDLQYARAVNNLEVRDGFNIVSRRKTKRVQKILRNYGSVSLDALTFEVESSWRGRSKQRVLSNSDLPPEARENANEAIERLTAKRKAEQPDSTFEEEWY